MTLGIAVVYLVQPGHGALLDLHLERIARHTRVSYTIYASANRLLPPFLERLTSRPEVQVVDCPSASLRGMAEHSHYLEHLVRAAVNDGASHVATLHVDSFPVRDGWAETLTGRLSPRCALATPPEVNTACLLFSKAFYAKHQPTFLPPAEMRESPEFAAFRAETGAANQSGVGYGLAAHRAGLTWYRMVGTGDTRDKLVFGVLYDDLVYHLVGAVRVGSGASAPRALQSRPFEAIAGRARRWARSLVPANRRHRLWRSMAGPLEYLFERPQLTRQRDLRDAALAELLADPDGYLQRLRERGVRSG